VSSILKKRFGAIYLLALLFIAISALTRAVLLVKTSASLDLTFVGFFAIFAVGLLYDLITLSYFWIPLITYLLVLPDRVYNSRFHKPVMYAVYFAAIYGLLFDGAAEWLFWDEFGTRFNFIAVDYLVYTHEVIGNIKESYPLKPLLAVLFLCSLLLLLMIRKSIELTLSADSTLRTRLTPATSLLAVPLLAFMCVDGSFANVSQNRYQNELAGNGIYNFFAAFRNNQLNYTSFYHTEADEEALKQLRVLLDEPDTHFVNNRSDDLTREIHHSSAEKRMNVALITVESLSAEFLGAFGNTRGLTPNLDRLAEQSLLFTNFYATGTRTVRGLEAISLSLPPTPGRSIVKRPHNEGLFSVGYVFRKKGYDTGFIYGGYGYFDNMNYFFAHNGFDVIDRTLMGQDEIHFSNIWGVADEDLFERAIKEMDKSHNKGRPFFHLIMTTSNHRPFTYPEGRIDIPSHTGREGGVKYTDYAIGRFIEQARHKPWFENTLFVVVADHCASSAGKTELPVDRYRIPLMIYAPGHIKAQRIDTLASQIDVAPTILGLLNFSYRTKFFGHDITRAPKERGRALIGNYQKLGYLTDDHLVVLAPRKALSTYTVNLTRGAVEKSEQPAAGLIHDATAYYQGADYLFEHRLHNWDP